jgi:uncharacterized membrane protein
MTPVRRRIVQAVLYEIVAIIVVGPVLGLLFDKPVAASLGLAALLSAIALTWNYVFNAIFETWESRQASRTRTPRRRILHGLGFEGGLVFLLVPVMAWGLDTSLWAAFLANLGLLVFFFVYAIAFTWAFDTIFGPPASATGGKP